MTRLAAAIRGAEKRPLPADLVDSCLTNELGDQLFRRARRYGLSTLTGHERAALSPVTGHVAESVAELLLAAAGHHLVWHWSGPGGHGIDLLVLTAAEERLVAVEVKGTLRAGRWPRPTRGRPEQLSPAWMDRPENIGMAQWQLQSAHVSGAMMLMNFADGRYRVLVTDDFFEWKPGDALLCGSPDA